MSEAALPAGKTCKDCRHFFTKCIWFLGLRGNETVCDWVPSRFREKPAETPQPKGVE